MTFVPSSGLLPVLTVVPWGGQVSRLARPNRTEILIPDDGWLAPSSKKSDLDAMEVVGPDGEGEAEEGPNYGKDVDEGPPGIRYISLNAHPAFAIGRLSKELHRWGDNATFVIRHE
ncbi:hypothetical protein B0H15DRAFT_806745 [Mycena belliarum]|uniref:Uncharacterized protein n=1 Tax=Mycena belliarum TaxID=1033014 RepID=A0AAD6TT42_9AGAR|nr:hypothetical protein B0H15DRAFT_806745 [Mycena belliae]